MKQTVLTTAFMMFCAFVLAGGQPLSPTVTQAQHVTYTPAGLVTITGATAALLPDASADASAGVVLQLAAPARIVLHQGFSVLLMPQEWSAPLYPGQTAPGEGCNGASYGVLRADGSSLVFGELTTDSCEDELTGDGRALARRLPDGTGAAVLLEDLASGQRTTLRVRVLDDEGNVLQPAIQQTPQLAADDTVLWPSNNVLELLSADGVRLWKVDEVTELIAKLALSADRRRVLVVRLGGALEVRDVENGSLMWSDPDNGSLLAALHQSEIVTDDEFQKKTEEPGTSVWDTFDVQPAADGWLVFGYIIPDRGWVAHVACSATSCAAELVRPDVLRAAEAVIGLSSGSGEYALDTDLSVLHKAATGWERIQ